MNKILDVWNLIPVPFQILIVSCVFTYIVVHQIIPRAKQYTENRVFRMPQNGIEMKDAHELTKMWRINNYHDPKQITDKQFKRTTGMSKVDYIESTSGLHRTSTFDLELMINDRTLSQQDKSAIKTALQRKRSHREWRSIRLD